MVMEIPETVISAECVTSENVAQFVKVNMSDSSFILFLGVCIAPFSLLKLLLNLTKVHANCSKIFLSFPEIQLSDTW